MKLIQHTAEIIAGELRTCPVCGSRQAYPIEHCQQDFDSWRLLMLCPNCFAWRQALVDTETLSAMGRHSCREHEALEEQLARLERKNMREMVESFISALRSGQIQPIDF